MQTTIKSPQEEDGDVEEEGEEEEGTSEETSEDESGEEESEEKTESDSEEESEEDESLSKEERSFLRAEARIKVFLRLLIHVYLGIPSHTINVITRDVQK